MIQTKQHTIHLSACHISGNTAIIPITVICIRGKCSFMFIHFSSVDYRFGRADMAYDNEVDKWAIMPHTPFGVSLSDGQLTAGWQQRKT